MKITNLFGPKNSNVSNSSLELRRFQAKIREMSLNRSVLNDKSLVKFNENKEESIMNSFTNKKRNMIFKD